MTIEALLLPPSGPMPNHPTLPVLIYRRVEGADSSGFFETRFADNGWRGIWRNGVFAYHHYHSKAHEVLGVGRGNARLQIGGPDGPILAVEKGDCLLLPAGTGHKRIDSSNDFQVVGAYPQNVDVDIQKDAPSAEMLARIEQLAIPANDPITGQVGGLLDYWSKSASR